MYIYIYMYIVPNALYIVFRLVQGRLDEAREDDWTRPGKVESQLSTSAPLYTDTYISKHDIIIVYIIPSDFNKCIKRCIVSIFK
jgi:hypothetical protein